MSFGMRRSLDGRDGVVLGVLMRYDTTALLSCCVDFIIPHWEGFGEE